MVLRRTSFRFSRRSKPNGSRLARSPSRSPAQQVRQRLHGRQIPPKFLMGIGFILLFVLGGTIWPSLEKKSSSLRASAIDTDRCRILETSSPSFLATLTELNLKDCQLSSLSTDIKYCIKLQKLDISDNPQLTTLPDELRSCTELEILFSSQNPGMAVLPSVLGQLTALTRLGWRSGALASLPAESIPPNVVHLILTDNQIQDLSDDDAVWDRLRHVRKLMLSHNQIRALSPTGVSQMVNLELMRLAGNQLTSIPDTLWLLPKLTWLTISGNPGLGLPQLPSRVTTVMLQDIPLSSDANTHLGAGASGSVTARTWLGRDVAVKVIHGVTSDGRAEDELQMYAAVGSDGMAHHVVGCLAVFHGDDQGNDKSGVVMERIPIGVDGQPLQDLALPPTIREVTVDRWVPDASRVYDASFIRHALTDAVDALLYLHRTARVAHGDFYAHNIKVDVKSGRLYLLDLGAAWATGIYAERAEKLEVRAFGILVQELLEKQQDGDTQEGQTLFAKLMPLAESCLKEDVNTRPTFEVISRTMKTITPS